MLKAMSEDADVTFKRILDLSMMVGRIMLENGAEIYRVEDTMKRISLHYGIVDENFFVLSNGIFTTGSDNRGKKLYAKVEHIPVHGAELNKVIELNQLSRDICKGKVTLEEAEKRIEEIRNLPHSSWIVVTAATCVGSACFTVLLSGTITDALGAGVAGLLLGLFNCFVFSKYLSKVTGNILASLLVTFVCISFHLFTTTVTNMNAMVAGSIISLIPGVAFLNGIRDIANGDYISGSVRLLDAILVFTCIAVGVGVAFILYNAIGGTAL
ncbi:MAG: threonine/serine exporter family protein [Spirochaetales bacterium]|nr:threonine/serine exporter family protein [Spirochaetales bacterium]